MCVCLMLLQHTTMRRGATYSSHQFSSSKISLSFIVLLLYLLGKDIFKLIALNPGKIDTIIGFMEQLALDFSLVNNYFNFFLVVVLLGWMKIRTQQMETYKDMNITS